MIGREGADGATTIGANDARGSSCCVAHETPSDRLISASAARTSRRHSLIFNDYSPVNFVPSHSKYISHFTMNPTGYSAESVGDHLAYSEFIGPSN